MQGEGVLGGWTPDASRPPPRSSKACWALGGPWGPLGSRARAASALTGAPGIPRGCRCPLWSRDVAVHRRVCMHACRQAGQMGRTSGRLAGPAEQSRERHPVARLAPGRSPRRRNNLTTSVGTLCRRVLHSVLVYLVALQNKRVLFGFCNARHEPAFDLPPARSVVLSTSRYVLVTCCVLCMWLSFDAQFYPTG